MGADLVLEEDTELVAADNLDYTAAKPYHTLAVEVGCKLPVEAGCKLAVEDGCKLPVEAGCNLAVEADRNLAVEAGCSLLANVLTEGNAVPVGAVWSTSGWSTRAFGELLVETRLQSQVIDSGSTDNKHNRSKPRWK